MVAVPGLVEGTFPVAARAPAGSRTAVRCPPRCAATGTSLPDVDLAWGGGPGGRRLQRLGAYSDATRVHHLAEERRLAYVAVTRARSSLLLAGLAVARRREAHRTLGVPPEVVDAAERREVSVARTTWVADPVDEVGDGVARRARNARRDRRSAGRRTTSGGRATVLEAAGAAVRDAIAHGTPTGAGRAVDGTDQRYGARRRPVRRPGRRRGHPARGAPSSRG